MGVATYTLDPKGEEYTLAVKYPGVVQVIVDGEVVYPELYWNKELTRLTLFLDRAPEEEIKVLIAI